MRPPVFFYTVLQLLLKNGDFLNTNISQGSVATRLGCGGVFVHDFVTNFLLRLTVKEFWKSANIWWRYGQELGVLFFLTHGVGASSADDDTAVDIVAIIPVRRWWIEYIADANGFTVITYAGLQRTF